jgi:uncharacterized membrane protein YedE/YeeE
MSESLIGLPILAGSFVMALVMGAVAHKTHFCTMGGVSDWINMGDKGRLGAWLLAIAVAVLGVMVLELQQIADLDNTRPPYRSSNFAWPRYLLGGLMFGVGMTLASGCTTKTLIRLGGGNLKSAVVLLVVGIFAYLMTRTDFYGIVFHSWMQPLSLDLGQLGLSSQDLGNLLGTVVENHDTVFLRAAAAVAVAGAIVVFVLATAGIRGNGNNLFAGLVVGLCITGGWYLTGGPIGQEWIEAVEWLDERPVGVAVQSYTFVNPVGETLSYFSDPGNTLLLTFGVAAVFGIVIGAFLYAVISGKFRIEWFASWSDFLRHIIGAALMGIGGVLALGCTIGQGISGVSTLALGSFLALGATILGSVIAMKVEYYRIVYEDASWSATFLSTLVDLRLLPKSLRRLESV